MSIILNDFENIFGTGPDQSQVGANLETMNIAAATIGDLTVTGTITMDGIELGTETLVAPAISTGYFRIVSPLAANMPLVFSPQGTGGVIVGPTPDGTAVGGNARGTYSVDMQFARTAATQVASGTGSFMVATQQCTISTNYSSAISSFSSTITAGIDFCSLLATGTSDISISANCAIIGSSGNTLTSGTTTSIVASQASTINNVTICSIIGSSNIIIDGGSTLCSIMGSDNSRAQVTSQQSGVLFSANSRVQTTVNSSVIASTDSQVNSATQSAVLASTLSIINGALLSANLICATNNVTLTSCTGAFSSASNGGGANGSQWSSLQSCSSTSIIGAANSSALCSNAGSIGPGSTYSMLACGTTSNLTGNYIAAFGNNVLVAANNNAFIFSDSSAGTISPPNNDSFTVRATGATAAVFYTNAAATTGVQIAAGASAWAAVSDRTLKENLVLLDTDWAAQTVSALPIYTYNFIGNPVEQRCIGPMAQDWAALYPTNKSSRHIDTGDIAGITLGALQNILRRLAVLEEMVGVKKL